MGWPWCVPPAPDITGGGAKPIIAKPRPPALPWVEALRREVREFLAGEDFEPRSDSWHTLRVWAWRDEFDNQQELAVSLGGLAERSGALRELLTQPGAIESPR